MFFVVDRSERRLRLLETALDLEGGELEGGGGDEIDKVEAGSEDTLAQILMMSPRAARRFGIRPPG
jgi:hypothetical protein